MSEANPTPADADAAAALQTLAAERAERERLQAELTQARQRQATEADRAELAKIDERIEKHDYETATAKLKARLSRQEADAQRQAIVHEAYALAKQHGRDLLSPELAPILALGPTPATLAALRAFLQAQAAPPVPPAQAQGKTAPAAAAPEGTLPKDGPTPGTLAELRQRHAAMKKRGATDKEILRLKADLRKIGKGLDDL